MESMVLERLEAWVKNAANQPQGSTGPRRLPSSILFYRDGLSDSQFDECVKTEVQAVENAFLELVRKHNQSNARLRLTFVVVGKRHHTRFFPKRVEDSHGAHKINGNVRPGLLVNDIITTPNDLTSTCNRTLHQMAPLARHITTSSAITWISDPTTTVSQTSRIRYATAFHAR